MAERLDLFNQFWTRAVREDKFRSYKPLLRGTQAFYLDDETLDVVHAMAAGPKRHKLIPMYRELARLPFDHVWIEFDFQHLRQLQIAAGTAEVLQSDRTVLGTPTKMAFFCERLVKHEEAFRVTTIGHMSPDLKKADPPEACVFPVCHNVTTGRDKVMFTLNRHDWAEMGKLVDQANRSILPAIAWGMDTEIDSESWKTSPLYMTNGIEPEGTFTDMLLAKDGPHEGLREIAGGIIGFVKEQMGDIRYVVAALALLNHVPVIYKPHKPKGRMLASGTTRPYLESRVVTINVPNTHKRIKIIDRELRNSLALQRRKRHRVRGHWRVSPKPHGPRWEPYTDPFTLSRRYRIWIADHERGDASLGWVDHTYNVTGRPGARAAVGLEPDDHPEASR